MLLNKLRNHPKPLVSRVSSKKFNKINGLKEVSFPRERG